ncbi:hypothetical protein STRAU_2998 [Streptomyces aurantiacus JA 4570]|uniref:Uncharacterized protein n=1 Tax=Streptomyces aurantiacus JA 4570 TaxID=1286094 RepID=S3ZMD1_9ACTN|nr:hypothetical protein STRAU_2998 [Streptomyces aurantiacus JA 4570]
MALTPRYGRSARPTPGPASRLSPTSAKMGSRQDRAPTKGPKKSGRIPADRPVVPGKRGPAHGAHAWRT